MANKHATLAALFTDIADAIREKTGDTASIVADDFPDVIRSRLQLGPFEPEGKSYLTFSSPNSFTLEVKDSTKHWDGTLEYFASDRTWTTWDGTTTLSSATKGSDNVLYLRGTGNTVITGNNIKSRWVLTGSNIACIGNIENLLDYATVESGSHPAMANYCYKYMLAGHNSLTTAPALPATTLTDQCYCFMFSGCTSLTTAPALPATTLASSCYSSMFKGCTSLTTAPALPATTLTINCYYYMFNDCGSLYVSDTSGSGYTNAWKIPTTGIASGNHIMTNMFTNCRGTRSTDSQNFNGIQKTYYTQNVPVR